MELVVSGLFQEDVEAEMRRLWLELKHTMDMYSKACKEVINAKQKVIFFQPIFLHIPLHFLLGMNQARELHWWRLEEDQKLE